MRLIDIISKDNIVDELNSTTKEGVVKELVEVLVNTKKIPEDLKEVAIQEIMDRENLGSTGIGNGLAIPHHKNSKVVKQLLGAFGKSSEGIEYGAIDGELSHVFFLFFSPDSPQDEGKPHLKVLKTLSLLGRDPNFCRFLKDSKDCKEIYDLIDEIDEKMASSM